ncbi:MAG: helix-turn-helix domain-containing protein [Candidatus Methanoperedens sp.]|nr:helix-turn-helix domain-containing protein [Candidatus Methanoperedens sp.]MCZ7370298.1 helix-turn-helix domain-containing protein [Candidatus Methanoperedens sp.]
MPENVTSPPEEKLLILPLGDESKKITQVISNDTARQIIEMLADVPLSASDIGGRLNAPISTIMYNLENLESVGLIKVEKIKYSEKGREVKIYGPVRKLIVVVPEKTDKKSVADILRKYLGVMLAAFFASGLIEFFTRRVGPIPTVSIKESEVNTTAVMNETVRGMTQSAAISGKAVAPGAPVLNATPIAETDTLTRIEDMIYAHPGILFFIGCLFVVVLLVAMDYRRNGHR